EQLAQWFILLVIAGTETTRQAISHGVLMLDRHPDQNAAWWQDFARVAPTAAEEIVRWSSPVMAFRRTLTRDAVLSGQQLAARAKVMLFYPSPPPPPGTSGHSPTRTGLTSPALPTPIWATAGLARTTASARTWPGPRSRPSSGPCSRGCPTCRSPATRTGSALPASMASSTCRSVTPRRAPAPDSHVHAQRTYGADRAGLRRDRAAGPADPPAAQPRPPGARRHPRPSLARGAAAARDRRAPDPGRLC